MTDFLPWIERLGFPIAVLLLLAYAIGKVARWSAPRIEAWINLFFDGYRQMVDNHKRLTDKSIELGEKSLDLQTSSLQAQKTNAETLVRLEQTIQKNGGKE